MIKLYFWRIMLVMFPSFHWHKAKRQTVLYRHSLSCVECGEGLWTVDINVRGKCHLDCIEVCTQMYHAVISKKVLCANGPVQLVGTIKDSVGHLAHRKDQTEARLHAGHLSEEPQLENYTLGHLCGQKKVLLVSVRHGSVCTVWKSITNTNNIHFLPEL